jgi:sugar lactone lactonase YvrE
LPIAAIPIYPVFRHFRRLAVVSVTLFLSALVARAQVSPSNILQPSGVAFDAQGNLYFADASRNQIYESTLAGNLVLIAGNGTQGFAGDGAAATAAELNHPESIAIDTSGTLYVADTGNQRIRSIAAGIITTFAGTGAAAFAGDNGPAISAALHTPTAIALDSTGSLLVCDTGNHRLRRISSGIITTIAGTSSQGFSGDSGPAIAAQLDSPSGIAVAPDGRIFFADTHNDRIRLISNGIITTVAGTGSRGYGGDNGPATAASLALPRGLTFTSAGNLLFADSNNQRIRQIDTQGTITTLAGNGVQGSAPDAVTGHAASLNTPRSVAMSTFDFPTFTDAPDHTLHELVAAANLYRPAGLTAPPRMSAVSLSLPATAYGQTTASVTVSGAAGVPQGTIQILQGSTIVATAQLTSGSASIPLPSLPTGSYTFTAAYAGDGINPAAEGGPSTLTIGQAIATATANATTITWGQPIPPLTGTLSGILAQDANSVAVTFSSSATPLSPPGTYTIIATLSGSASTQYTVVLSPNSGSLHILQAPTLTLTQPLSQSSYAGLPLILSASVIPSPSTSTKPTGIVTFFDSSTTIATSSVNAGVATAIYPSPGAGNHSITASYSGNTDFAPSTSPAVTTSVGPMPDFLLKSSGGLSQTVTAGSIATYNLDVSPLALTPFTGVVSFSVSGLPANATASFAPAQVVPGSSIVPVVLTIQTPTAKVMVLPRPVFGDSSVLYALLFLPCFFFGYSKRKHLQKYGFIVFVVVVTFSGCGDRVTPVNAPNAATYNLTVTGTSTNLAGAVVTHSISLILKVD